MRAACPTIILAAISLTACTAQAQSDVAVPAAAMPASPVTQPAPPPGTTAQYHEVAMAELAERKRVAAMRRGQAKNIVIFIGDGMGVSTLTAARILAGERMGVDGESLNTTMDTLDHTALVKTYAHDGQVSDSASTATAFLSGTKTRRGILGLGPQAMRGDCATATGGETDSIIALAQDRGLATGVVTTTRITHATPAAAYSHSVERGWEADRDVSAEAQAAGCTDIAAQLVEGPVGSRLDVIMGGGRRAFLPGDAPDPEYPDRTGSRTDGRDLAALWQANNPDGLLAFAAPDLAGYDPATGGPIMALFEPSHMQYEADRAGDGGGEPHLADMVDLAIRRLSQDDNGFVLLVEGGRIDHAHHGGNANRALTDAIALDEAVARALSLVDLDETLVVTTADHSHVFTIAGYPGRGNPILGTVANNGEEMKARDGKAYTTLGYGNGPGAVMGERADPADEDTTALDYQQQAAIPLGSETHAGEDVVVRASGPGAQLFSGTIEQHTIFWIMREALMGTPAQ